MSLHVGYGNSIKKVKAIYAGVNNAVKKVKSVYGGISNAVKLLWRGDVLERISTPKMENAKYLSSAAMAGSHVIVYGGKNADGDSNTAEAFDDNLMHQTGLAKSTYPAWDANAASVGKYAVFASGKRGNYDDYATNGFQSGTFAYSSELTKTDLSSTVGRTAFMGRASFADRAIFAGGLLMGSSHPCSNAVYAYTASLTQSKLANLDAARENIGAAVSGNVLVLAGGDDWSSESKTVDIYTSSLAKTTSAELPSASSVSASAVVGDYALFLGKKTFSEGSSGNGFVYAFKNGVQLTPIEIPFTMCNCAGASLHGYAVFAGSIDPISGESIANTVVFDQSLTQCSAPMLSESKGFMASAVIGDYGLFVGGKNADGIVGSVDAFRPIEN